MAIITRTYTFTDGTTAYGSQVDSEIANIVNVINSLDAGTTTWDTVKLAAIIPTAAMDFNSQRIKNLGAPTTTNDAARYPVTDAQMSANTLTAASMAAGAAAANLALGDVTQIQISSSAGISTLGGGDVTQTSESITTTGGKVLCIGLISYTSGGSNVASSLFITQGSNSIPGNAAQWGDTNLVNYTAVVLCVDTPTAGTYTYNLKYNFGGHTPTIAYYSLILIELKK